MDECAAERRRRRRRRKDDSIRHTYREERECSSGGCNACTFALSAKNYLTHSFFTDYNLLNSGKNDHAKNERASEMQIEIS
jgi:hypothetical protein